MTCTHGDHKPCTWHLYSLWVCVCVAGWLGRSLMIQWPTCLRYLGWSPHIPTCPSRAASAELSSPSSAESFSSQSVSGTTETPAGPKHVQCTSHLINVFPKPSDWLLQPAYSRTASATDEDRTVQKNTSEMRTATMSTMFSFRDFFHFLHQEKITHKERTKKGLSCACLLKYW